MPPLPQFPNLGFPPAVTSPATPLYNCIAWAFGDNTRWWWPGGRAFWPSHVPAHVDMMTAFEGLFSDLGWVEATDDSLETGFIKIALYADANGVPTHAARQLSTGQWTSKLGQQVDIAHSIGELDGPKYGSVARFYKKQT